jgi:hypothetical protein
MSPKSARRIARLRINFTLLFRSLEQEEEILKIQTALLLALAGSALASPITFTISTSASGTLGGTAFSDNTITFTQVTDTSLIANCGGPGIMCSPIGPGNTVTISGLGTYTINDETYFYDNSSVSGAGFTDAGGDVLDEVDPAFATYLLQTAIGPIFDTQVLNSYTGMSTTGGILSYTGNSLDATFTAVTGSSSAPEPGSLGLILMGAFGLHAVRSRIVRRGYDLHESCADRNRFVAGRAGDAARAGARR